MRRISMVVAAVVLASAGLVPRADATTVTPGGTGGAQAVWRLANGDIVEVFVSRWEQPTIGVSPPSFHDAGAGIQFAVNRWHFDGQRFVQQGADLRKASPATVFRPELGRIEVHEVVVVADGTPCVVDVTWTDFPRAEVTEHRGGGATNPTHTWKMEQHEWAPARADGTACWSEASGPTDEAQVQYNSYLFTSLG